MEKMQSHERRRTERRRFTKMQRAEHLSAWEGSGLSAMAYAREHGITDKNLYAWRRQSRLENSRTETPESTAFVPVRISTPLSTSMSSLTLTLRSAGIEVELCGLASSTELASLAGQTSGRCSMFNLSNSLKTAKSQSGQLPANRRNLYQIHQRQSRRYWPGLLLGDQRARAVRRIQMDSQSPT